MNRIHTFSRFEEPAEIGPIEYCANCGGDIYENDSVTRSTEGDTVHDDCWRDYAERYISESGVINSKGEIE
ncbi:hypothetical protein [Aneurinibacillus migulanus]|uniref:hypothetical protein n=1 Tax=Aneurinibacillus migulanus TaxID=47500 RepID=UPI00209E9EEB|nr:hypothetical protein [Aneurinibacillus migulanus]MCP1354621.1 hypothetical protein [Aneurinibacillus migulanus]